MLSMYGVVRNILVGGHSKKYNRYKIKINANLRGISSGINVRKFINVGNLIKLQKRVFCFDGSFNSAFSFLVRSLIQILESASFCSKVNAFQWELLRMIIL